MRLLLPLSVLLVALSACRTEEELNQLHGLGGMRTGEIIRNASIERAIVTQHTLYPYHFMPGTPQLNPLGRRDLDVLVRHFRYAGGEVNLSRGDANEELYAARGQALVAELKTAGIPGNRVSVAEGRPGGEGMSGARLVRILEAARNPLAPAPQAGGSGAGASVSTNMVQQ